jgi:ABC-2 type transport system permease protein
MNYPLEQIRKPFHLHLRDIGYLIISQLLYMRTGWQWYLCLSGFIPIITLFFLFLVLGYQIRYANYVVTGNVVFTEVIGSLNTLADQMGWMKQNKYFEHYAILPISKISLIIAFVTRSTLFSLIPMIGVLFIGKLLYHLPIIFHPLSIIVYIVSGFALSGIGACIGIYSKNSNLANITTQVVFPILVFTAPVMLPLDNFPPIIRYWSIILPTTYIANAFRDSLSGIFGLNFWCNLGIIFFFAFLSLYLVARKFDWRVD